LLYIVTMRSLTCENGTFTHLDIVKFPACLIGAANEIPLVGSKIKAVDLVFVFTRIAPQRYLLFELDKLNIAQLISNQNHKAVFPHVYGCYFIFRFTYGLFGFNHPLVLFIIIFFLFLLQTPNINASCCGSCHHQALSFFLSFLE